MIRTVQSAATHTGHVRSNNEDRLLCLAGHHVHLYAVADGMGGHAAGEVAAETAISAIKEKAGMIRSNTPSSTFPAHALAARMFARAFEAAQHAILQAIQRYPGCRGMGTTLTVCSIAPASVLRIGHIGDSVCLLVRKGRLERLTTKHVIPGNRLVCYLGGDSNGFDEPEYVEHRLEDNDTVILATDGVSDYLKSPVHVERVVQIVQNTPPDHLAQAIVDYALGAGGHDNATAIAIRVSAA